MCVCVCVCVCAEPTTAVARRQENAWFAVAVSGDTKCTAVDTRFGVCMQRLCARSVGGRVTVGAQLASVLAGVW